ncbi:MAG TPA: Hsp20/alpha crystallin family protein [Pseudolysinimonas sp.]|nr:Hsp20/alpha crystallin family protein [Pseudolysinimonas sp.]
MAMYLDSRPAPRLMPMDLSKTGDGYVLNADLPGIDPSSVDIDVDGRLLSIRAERPTPSTEGVTYLTRERRTGTFVRRFTLGQDVDTAGITAGYDNGVLTVTVPVAEKAKPRKIEVGVAPAAKKSAKTVQAVA